MIKIFRDLTYIIRECKLFLLHVLYAIKFIKRQQAGFTKARLAASWLLWSLFPSCAISLLLQWPAQARVLLLLLFSCSVVSDSLRPHGLQHARLPCPSPTPRVCSNSCPSSWWYHPTILSFVIPFSQLQSFSAPGSFPRSQFFTPGGQCIRVSVSASVFPMNIQDGLISFRMDWFDLLAVQIQTAPSTLGGLREVS